MLTNDPYLNGSLFVSERFSQHIFHSLLTVQTSTLNGVIF